METRPDGGTYLVQDDPEYNDAVSDIESSLAELQQAVEELRQALPDEVRHTGELSRHLSWSAHWLRKGRPRSCAQDAEQILERDLPHLKEAFDRWYDERSELDPRLAIQMRTFDKAAHVNSAARQAWAIFRTRTAEALELPDGIDGQRLANALFGQSGVMRDAMDGSECEGYLKLLGGLYALHRNPIAHNDEQPNPALADAVIVLLRHTLARIDGAAQDLS